MQNLSAVVILYNPGTEVIENILSYLPFIERLYVMDNSKNKSTVSDKIIKINRVTYLHDRENWGIAKRLNQAGELAIADGFEWLLTMDQDSSFTEEAISAYLACLENAEQKEQIAMAGVDYNGRTKEVISCKYREITTLITSGSIVNLKLFKQIGDFDEALFIDQVDFEYCYRSILKGFKIILFENIFLQHSLGEASVHKSFKSFKNTNRSLHAPFRIYYMTRNYFYIQAKYKKDFEAEIRTAKKDLLNRIKNNLFYNKKKLSVLKFLVLGYIDFTRNKMGKISN